MTTPHCFRLFPLLALVFVCMIAWGDAPDTPPSKPIIRMIQVSRANAADLKQLLMTDLKASIPADIISFGAIDSLNCLLVHAKSQEAIDALGKVIAEHDVPSQARINGLQPASPGIPPFVPPTATPQEPSTVKRDTIHLSRIPVQALCCPDSVNLLSSLQPIIPAGILKVIANPQHNSLFVSAQNLQAFNTFKETMLALDNSLPQVQLEYAAYKLPSYDAQQIFSMTMDGHQQRSVTEEQMLSIEKLIAAGKAIRTALPPISLSPDAQNARTHLPSQSFAVSQFNLSDLRISQNQEVLWRHDLQGGTAIIANGTMGLFGGFSASEQKAQGFFTRLFGKQPTYINNEVLLIGTAKVILPQVDEQQQGECARLIPFGFLRANEVANMFGFDAQPLPLNASAAKGTMRQYLPFGIKQCIAIDGLNAILVVADTQEAIDNLVSILKMLDKPSKRVLVKVTWLKLPKDTTLPSVTNPYNLPQETKASTFKYVKGNFLFAISQLLTEKKAKIFTGQLSVNSCESDGLEIALDGDKQLLAWVDNVLIHADDSTTIDMHLWEPGNGKSQSFIVRIKNNDTVMVDGYVDPAQKDENILWLVTTTVNHYADSSSLQAVLNPTPQGTNPEGSDRRLPAIPVTPAIGTGEAVREGGQ